MSDIDFLPNKSKDSKSEEKNKINREEDIEWSKPLENKLKEDKKKPQWFSFFNKKPSEKKLVKETKVMQNSQFKKDINKDKIKDSRKQVLKIIKENENKEKKQNFKTVIKKDKKTHWWDKFKKSKKDKNKKNISKDQVEVSVKEPAEIKVKDKQDSKIKESREVFNIRKKDDDDKSESLPKENKPDLVSNLVKKGKVIDEKTILESDKKSKKWENPNILETNLIKGEITFFFDWRKGIIKLSIAIIIVCFIVGGLYASLIYWHQQKEAESRKIAEKLEKINYEIKQAEEGVEDILFFQEKLNLVSSLLDQHIYWTNFFKFLEDHIVINSYIRGGGFGGDASGNYNFTIEGIDYNSIYQQIKTFKESSTGKVIKAETYAGTYSPAEDDESESSVNFNVELQIDPSIFYK